MGLNLSIVHLSTGCPKKNVPQGFFALICSRGPIILFHMCFGIRILILFQLNTLNIPIQNIRCPKTPKTHARTSFSPQPLFVKLELCRLCSIMPNPICVTGNAIHESHCSVQCFVLGYVIEDKSDYRVLLFVLQSMKCASMCLTHHL